MTRHPDQSAVEREARVLEARAAGESFDRIAVKVGYADRGAAHKAYLRALRRIVEPTVHEIRALEQERLDRLQAAVWGRAETGDIASITVCLRISERRARLLGLDQSERQAGHRVTLAEHQAHLLASGIEWLFTQLGLEQDVRARALAAHMFERLAAIESADGQ